MSRNPLRRPAVAMIAAILTVVLVSAGSATAAKMVTGKDIKNGSITGKDLKDKSVGKADLAADATAALTGPTGPVGPAGAAGAVGPAGPAVLSNVYVATLNTEGLAEDTPEIVLSKILPSGKPYLLSAKLNLVTVGVGEHTCELRSGPDVIDTAVVTTTVASSKNVIALSGVTPSSGLARVGCTIDGGPGSSQLVKLVAVPVASIG